MRRSIATVSLSGMLREKLSAAAAARFDGIEIFENDLLQFNGTPRDVRHMAEDLGLAIELFQPFRDFDGVDEQRLARNLERAERKFDVMGELGATLLLVCTNAQPEAFGDVERLADQMHRLAEQAAKRGIRIGYEALAWAPQVSRFSQAWAVVRQADHPHLGLALDSYHTLALQDDPAPIAQIPGERIFFVQLADAPSSSLDVLTLSRHHRCFPGQGEFDLGRFVGAVLDAGYTGPLSLEVFNDEFRAAPARPTAVDAMRSLLWLEEQVRARPSVHTRLPHGQHHRVPLFDPPAAPGWDGWSFIEFGVDPASAGRLARFFETLGFRLIGRHRSKDVELYGLGDVRVILNRQEYSLARAYFETHGVSACALALNTGDAAAALARAEALGCMRVPGRVGHNERAIPAVRAPDGSLFHFVDTDFAGDSGFEADFVFEEATAAPPGLDGGACIDHLVQVLPPGQVEPWHLFYRAVLGLTPDAGSVIHDPYGVIRSRPLESPDRRLRVALNVSERASTSAARSVQRFGGAGLQQIALRVPDVIAAAQALSALDAPRLAVPDNYYDDLAARHDIDPGLLQALRRHRILYDRDSAGGELLHLYTTPFEDRFHVELLERRNGYQHYGSVNAPVRLAAMARWREETIAH